MCGGGIASKWDIPLNKISGDVAVFQCSLLCWLWLQQSRVSATLQQSQTCPPPETWNIAAVNRNSILSVGYTPHTLVRWGPSLNSSLQISAVSLANHRGLTFEPLREGGSAITDEAEGGVATVWGGV